MTLVKRRPFFTDFFENDSFFDTLPKEQINRVPSVNITENDKEFKIELGVPGLKKDDFKLDVDKSTLTVSADKEEKVKEERKYLQNGSSITHHSAVLSCCLIL